jgi:hypothetical protein
MCERLTTALAICRRPNAIRLHVEEMQTHQAKKGGLCADGMCSGQNVRISRFPRCLRFPGFSKRLRPSPSSKHRWLRSLIKDSVPTVSLSSKLREVRKIVCPEIQPCVTMLRGTENTKRWQPLKRLDVIENKLRLGCDYVMPRYVCRSSAPRTRRVPKDPETCRVLTFRKQLLVLETDARKFARLLSFFTILI